MFPHSFIEFHYNNDSKQPLIINTEQVTTIAGHMIYVNHPKYSAVSVAESYQEICELINEAGQNFVRKDPRIDNHPLSMDELLEMVGEPVWSENKQKWYLVNAADPEIREVDLADSCSLAFTVYTEKELIARPLYRIRNTERGDQDD